MQLTLCLQLLVGLCCPRQTQSSGGNLVLVPGIDRVKLGSEIEQLRGPRVELLGGATCGVQLAVAASSSRLDFLALVPHISWHTSATSGDVGGVQRRCVRKGR